MSCEPEISHLAIPSKPIFSGDTWGGMDVVCATTGNAFDEPLASVSMVWKNSAGETGLTLINGSGITITDATSWTFRVDPILTFPLSAGTWSWQIRMTNAEGTKITRLAGTKTVKP